MVNQEQLVNGILRYLDAEVMSVLPTSGKWVAGTFITLASTKTTKLLSSLLTNPIVKGLDLVDDAGMIDSDALLCAMRTSAEKYGVLEIPIPIVGTLKFTSKDVDTLKRYVGGITYE